MVKCLPEQLVRNTEIILHDRIVTSKCFLVRLDFPAGPTGATWMNVILITIPGAPFACLGFGTVTTAAATATHAGLIDGRIHSP